MDDGVFGFAGNFGAVGQTNMYMPTQSDELGWNVQTGVFVRMVVVFFVCGISCLII